MNESVCVDCVNDQTFGYSDIELAIKANHVQVHNDRSKLHRISDDDIEDFSRLFDQGLLNKITYFCLLFGGKTRLILLDKKVLCVENLFH